jgi:hypothetical protein
MARQKKAKSNTGYPIPSDFPAERYVYAPAPTLANWTSYPKYSYEMFTRPNPALRPVPEHRPKKRRAKKNPKPSIPYADWRAALLRAEARKDKKLVQILKAAMDLGAVQQTRQAVAQQNPFDFTPKNAGPYLPDMFPYGVGGRPQTYDPLPTTPTPAEAAAAAAKAAATAKKNGKKR